ncbi:MAG: PD-(D/E)XK nuclease family protein [Eggerthellaceae bacterium]
MGVALLEEQALLSRVSSRQRRRPAPGRIPRHWARPDARFMTLAEAAELPLLVRGARPLRSDGGTHPVRHGGRGALLLKLGIGTGRRAADARRRFFRALSCALTRWYASGCSTRRTPMRRIRPSCWRSCSTAIGARFRGADDCATGFPRRSSRFRRPPARRRCMATSPCAPARQAARGAGYRFGSFQAGQERPACAGASCWRQGLSAGRGRSRRRAALGHRKLFGKRTNGSRCATALSSPTPGSGRSDGQLLPRRSELLTLPQRACEGGRGEPARSAGSHAETFERHLAFQHELKRSRNPLVPRTKLEEAEARALEKRLVAYLDREAALLPGFVPARFEFGFGSDGPFPYAGCSLRGSIDRIDVNDRGQAVVIDYKGSLGADYALDSSSEAAQAGGTALPHKVQALVYAQVARKLLGLDVVGALYVSYGRDGRLLGAFDRRVLGEESLPVSTQPAACRGRPGGARRRDVRGARRRG